MGLFIISTSEIRVNKSINYNSYYKLSEKYIDKEN